MDLARTGTGEGTTTVPSGTRAPYGADAPSGTRTDVTGPGVPVCTVDPTGPATATTSGCADTTDATAAAAEQPAGDLEAQVGRLGQELGRHARLLHLMKLRLVEAMPPGLDWAAFGLLTQLVRCGPRRQADLAEISLLDPSTVSRHAAQLVRAGLAERRPDPEDGRAVQLVSTDQGRAVWENGVRKRNEGFLAALSGWRAEDLQCLTDLLARFNDDLEAFRQNGTRAGPSEQS